MGVIVRCLHHARPATRASGKPFSAQDKKESSQSIYPLRRPERSLLYFRNI